MGKGCGFMQESKDIQQSNARYVIKQGCGFMQESKDIQQVKHLHGQKVGCGFMQESKDIQQSEHTYPVNTSCGFMQESKDIQQFLERNGIEYVVVLCRNQKIYNFREKYLRDHPVVVLCRNQKIYNYIFFETSVSELWFYVGIKRYTTMSSSRRR